MDASTPEADTVPLRRVVVWVTIGSFSIAALMGVVALLGGGSFGAAEGRILGTTLAVGCTSVAMLCYLATSDTPYAAVGAVGGVLVLAPFAVSLIIIWTETWNDELFRGFGVGVTVAATLAQVSLLLALAGARRQVALVLWATVTLAGVLALTVCILILGDSPDDGVLRFLGVVAILDVLGTVTTLALALFGRPDAPAPMGEVVAVQLPSDLDRRLTETAARTGSSREQLVADAVGRYLDAAEPH
ncbi:MAG: ribbon-helix-helix protein, CopG family [Nocardioides sp.]